MPDDASKSPRPAQNRPPATGSSGGGRSRSRNRRGSGSSGRGGSGNAQRRGAGASRAGQRPGQQRGGSPRPRPQASPVGPTAPAPAAAVAHGVQVLDRAVDDPTAAVAGNRRRAAAVAATPSAVLVVLGVLLGIAGGELVLGVVVGAAVAVAGVAVVWRGAATMLLRAMEARLVDEDDVPGPATLVEGLCASMGLRAPDLYVVDETLPNAIAVGRSPRHAAIVLTTGLLARLDPVQLEGVLAHELAHVKRNDVAPATMAAALVQAAFFLPGASGIVHLVAGRGREFATDRQAVRVTRYPPGLSQALAVLSDPAPVSAVAARRVGQVTRWLWTVVLPDSTGRHPEGDELVGELDAPAVRVAALDEW